MGRLTRRIARWGQALLRPEEGLRQRYEDFKALLAADERSLVLVAELDEIFAGTRQVDPARTRWLCERLSEAVGEVVAGLWAMRPDEHPGLEDALGRIRADLARQFAPVSSLAMPSGPLLMPLAQALGSPELAGGKAANLAAARQAGLRVPSGLVVSTLAFRRFLASGSLRPRLDRLLRQVDLARPERIGPLCAGLRALVLGAPVPEDLAQALRAAVEGPELAGSLLAVRSSAVAEDGEASFAGQYASELNVPPQDVVEAYRRVVASKYRPRAVTYRVRQGIADEAAPMAVLLLPMIPAAAAGVLHTSEARVAGPGRCAAVFALPGLGDELVSGRAEPRVLRMARKLPVEILSAVGEAEVDLAPGALSDLLMAGLVLESALGGPQEVEWAVDREGHVFVLQSRTHCQAAQEPAAPRDVVRPDARTLAEGLTAVSRGVGCGPVFHLEPGADVARIPAGCVLAADSLAPALARCADRISAVASRLGSRASHFGSVARECGLPVVSGLENPRAMLPAGLLVTVDADGCRILAGCADSLQGGWQRRLDADRQRLRARFAHLARLTCRLGLTDPEAADFCPRGCASLHDLVRYCHEKAVAEMAGLAAGVTGNTPESGRPGRGLGRARRLASDLPLSLYLLDLGGGLAPESAALSEVPPQALSSLPMRALWRGLTHPGEPWPDKGFACDWGEFDRISAGFFFKDSKSLGSLALVSADYLHLLVRFGYHFAVLDCLCGPRPEANYACLRFKGGGGLPEQRRLRLVFVTRVLAAAGFSVRVRGDMLDARLSRVDEDELVRVLELLGRLLVRTRRMDLGLSGEAQAEGLARDFLAACAEAAGAGGGA